MKIFITLFIAILFTFPSGTQANLQTRDKWRSVRTNNLFVIGNAEAEKLRQVAVWLEFFHSAFGRVISRNVIDSSVPTTVIVFRDDASFRPFKPLYQGRPANLSGFFQPGDDVNYIAISLDPSERDPFNTAFHEYVHLHVKDNIPGAPLWLNEGLAELYGSLQFSGNDALLGMPLPYLGFLRQAELLPLTTLFSIGTNSQHYNEEEKTGVFYGQSWALVHYLMLGDRNRQEQFKRFLNRISQGDTSEKAVEETFGASLSVIEQELHAYVRRGDFTAQRLGGIDDPQTYCLHCDATHVALRRRSELLPRRSAAAHRPRQRCRALLQTSYRTRSGVRAALRVSRHALHTSAPLCGSEKVSGESVSSPQNYMIHYLYAYVLSREGVSPSGRISEYPRESVALMREQLLRSIKLAPDYAPAHYLLALVNFVADERLDEAVEMAQRARQLAPSKTNYSLLLAQIYLRRSDAAAARQILEPLTRDSDQSIRTEAQNLLESLSGTAGSNRGKTASAPAVSSDMIAEPVKTNTSRILGGESGSVAIRDGQTIENSGSLPTVDEVLDRYIEALGGAAALKAVTSRTTKGTLDVIGHSRGGSYETYEQAPNKMLHVFQAPPLATVKVGFNGRTGWVTNRNGLRMLKGVELARVQRDADFYASLGLKKNFTKVTLAGMSKIGYRDVYVIDLQPALGMAQRIYLDAQTHLLARVNTALTFGPVSEHVEMYLDDWREVDGVKLPFTISYRFPKLTLSINIKEIRHNVALDPTIFDSPM